MAWGPCKRRFPKHDREERINLPGLENVALKTELLRQDENIQQRATHRIGGRLVPDASLRMVFSSTPSYTK